MMKKVKKKWKKKSEAREACRGARAKTTAVVSDLVSLYFSQLLHIRVSKSLSYGTKQWRPNQTYRLWRQGMNLERAFSPPFQTIDIDNMASAQHPVPLPSATEVTSEEVESAIRRSKPVKAPRINRIANRGFRWVLKIFLTHVTHLFQSCIKPWISP